MGDGLDTVEQVTGLITTKPEANVASSVVTMEAGIDGANKPDLDVKSDIMPTADGKSEQKDRIGEKTDRVDELFNELLGRAAESPEALDEAKRVLIDDMRNLAQQMKTAGDMAALQELKMQMLNNWNQLKEETQGNPELLKGIQDWGKKFATDKSLYYDRINEVKAQMAEQSATVSGVWTDMQINLGEATGKVSNIHPEIFEEVKKILYKKEMDFGKLEAGNLIGFMNEVSGLDKFIKSMTDIDSGYDGRDINIDEVQQFLVNLNRVVSLLAGKASAKGYNWGGDKSPQDADPTIRDNLDYLVERIKELDKEVAKSLKIFMVTKKISDTHFLDAFNDDLESSDVVA